MTSTNLAAIAAAEVASRETHYPAMIKAGEIDQAEAEADLAAWRTIAALAALRDGPGADGWTRNPRFAIDTDLEWPALEAAAERAHARLAERAAAAPADAKLGARRDAVRAVLDHVGRHRRFWAPAGLQAPQIAA